MSEIAAGMWPCKVLGAFYGDNDKNLPVVRINVQISDGPHKGQMTTYEDVVDAKQARYIMMTCKAVGWQCSTLATLAADVAAWIDKTGGESTVEIKHIEVKRGKKFDAWVDAGMEGPRPVWVKANSIGRGPKPLRASTTENLSDADEAMRRALADEGGSAGPSDDIPPPGDPDVPFITLVDRRTVRAW